MATYHLSVPSKTFIVGEYIALKGGPTLILSTNPRFELKATSSNPYFSDIEKLAHPDSPAGKLIRKDRDFILTILLSLPIPIVERRLWRLHSSIFNARSP